MGQGTSKYRKITRTLQTGENAGKKLRKVGGSVSFPPIFMCHHTSFIATNFHKWNANKEIVLKV